MGEFEGKVIVVTGGGSGIGRATALLFGRDRARVAILDNREEAGCEAAEEIRREGGTGVFYKADVSCAEDLKRSFSDLTARFGGIDVLYANAAFQKISPLAETTEEDFNRTLAVNLTGTFLCCREAIAPMRAKGGGSIIICSSGHAFHTYPGYSAYAATKGGLVAFMRSAAVDLARENIRVNCIVPGATETPLLRDHFDKNPQDRERLIAQIPLRRLATPEDIARGVRLLASSDAAYITGAWLAVDGGLLAQG